MAYFFICPLYVLFLLGVVLLAAALLCVRRSRTWGYYTLGAGVGSLPGVLLANGVLWVAVVLLLRGLEALGPGRLPGWLDAVMKVIVAALLVVGPVAVSGLGALWGMGVGLACVRWFRGRRDGRLLDTASAEVG
jgi:hypothetical protein